MFPSTDIKHHVSQVCVLESSERVLFCCCSGCIGPSFPSTPLATDVWKVCVCVCVWELAISFYLRLSLSLPPSLSLSLPLSPPSPSPLSLSDLSLKILRDDSACPGACQVIQWVKGCFDALDKKFVRPLLNNILHFSIMVNFHSLSHTHTYTSAFS